MGRSGGHQTLELNLYPPTSDAGDAHWVRAREGFRQHFELDRRSVWNRDIDRFRGGGAGYGDGGDRAQVQQTAHATQELTANIASVSEVVSGTSAAAEQVLGAAGGLPRQAERLTQQVNSFVLGVRAA